MDLKLLNEGGVGGHMNHLYDNPNLTFGKMKEIFAAAANGKLVGTEKADGQNLSLTFNVSDKKAYAARNEGQAKRGGLNAVSMYNFFLKKQKEAEKQASEKGKDPKKAYNKNLKHTFSDAVIIFEKTIQKLSNEEQKFLFEEGDKPVFYNCEVMDVRTKNVVKYDVQSLILHRVGHYYLTEAYDEEGNLAKNTLGEQIYEKAEPTNISEKLSLLETIITNSQEELKKEKFGFEIGAIRNLDALSDKKQLEKAISRIDSLISSTNYSSKATLGDNSTVQQFLIARVKSEVKTLLTKNISKIGKLDDVKFLKIIKKIFDIGDEKDPKALHKNVLKKDFTPEQFEFIDKEIFEKSNVLILKAITPLEHIVSDFASDMLQGLKSVFVGAGSARGSPEPNKKEVERLKNLLDLAINSIKTSNNEVAMEVLERELKKLKSIERFNVAAEGFVFQYDGQVYKFTGNFAPANQILGLFKYGRKGVPAIAKDLGDLDPEREEEPGFIGTGKYSMNEAKKEAEAIKQKNIICIYPGRFQPMGKHHVEVFRQLQSIFGEDKVYIATSDVPKKPDPSKSPLNFEEKKSVMLMHDIPRKQIVKCVNPYKAEEIVSNFDPKDTAVVFAVGEKDMKEDPRFKTTDSSYFKFFNDTSEEDLKGYRENGYLTVAPHSQFKIETEDDSGKKVTLNISSGTQIREILASGDKNLFKAVMGFWNEPIYNLLVEKFREAVNYIKPPPKRGKKKKETKTESILHDMIEELLNETIKKRGNKYCLVSKKSGRNLGCYRSRKGAEKREKQVQYFKHIKEETGSPAVAGYTLPLGAKIKRTKEEEN